MIFDLADDFADILDAISPEHPRYRILNLLNEAIRRDVHFIALHTHDYPQGLFQCLWNSCWWHDASEAAPHYDLSELIGDGPFPWELSADQRLTSLLEHWHAEKIRRTPGFFFLRSMRPPTLHLGTAQTAVLRGHESDVSCIGVSCDGSRIVSGANDNTVRVWDATSGAEICKYLGHGGPISSTTFLPDGRQILSSDNNTFHVWDSASGSERLRIPAHNEKICSVAVSLDGLRIASGGADNTVRIWDAITGHEFHCLCGHTGSVRCLAFSPDGQRVASGSWDRTIRVWNLTGDGEHLCLRGHNLEIEDVFFSPDGQRLIARSWDSVRIWGATGKELLCIELGAVITGIALSQDCASIVTASYSMIQVFDTATGDQLQELNYEPGAVVVKRFLTHGTSNTGLLFSANGQHFLSWRRGDETVRVWDIKVGAQTGCLRGHEGDVLVAAFLTDGRGVVTGSADHTLRLWNTSSRETYRPLFGHKEKISRLAYSGDGGQLGSGSHDMTIRIWDTGTGREEFCLQGHEKSPYAHVKYLHFLDNKRLVSAGNRDIRIWDLASGKEIRCLMAGEYIVDISPDMCAVSMDRRRIACSSLAAWEVWDADTGVQLCSFNSDRNVGMPLCVAFAPDGCSVVCGAGDGVVRVWDLIRCGEPFCLPGHEGPVFSVSFSPDGARIVSQSRDKTLRVWDTDSGSSMAVLPGDEGSVGRVVYSADGHCIASETLGGSVRIWDAATFESLEAIPGTGDITAIAAGERLFPWRALARGLETEIEDVATGQVIARFSSAFERIVTHPSSRQWAGSIGNHVYIISLEGPEDSDRSDN